MGSSHGAGEMCLESGRAAARRGKKAAAVVGEKAAKQPQRGLGVAQLEKIRLHNQMVAAYRSGALHAPAGAPPPQQQAHFAGGASPLKPYLVVQDLLEATSSGSHHRNIIDAQYYDNLLPTNSSSRSPPPPLLMSDVKERSPAETASKKLGQFYWMSSGHEPGGRSGAEELDLELRL